VSVAKQSYQAGDCINRIVKLINSLWKFGRRAERQNIVGFEMLRRSRECVINILTAELVKEVVGIGKCSGSKMDKFKTFGLTPACGAKVLKLRSVM
jgi:hypothetical protein